jgi:hypothetical protein
MEQEPADESCFKNENLEDMLKVMGFEGLYIEDRPKELILQIGNHFIETMLDKCIELASKKKTGRVEAGDVRYIAEREFGEYAPHASLKSDT